MYAIENVNSTLLTNETTQIFLLFFHLNLAMVVIEVSSSEFEDDNERNDVAEEETYEDHNVYFACPFTLMSICPMKF